MIEEEGVRVLFDRAGVPHVRADSQLGAYFGQGYVVASERLWQLDLFRRTAAGRLSECFGPRALAGDRFQRSLALEHFIKMSVPRLAPDVRARVDAYCAGVNRFVEKNRLPPEFDVLGIEPEPWTVEDVLRCGALRSIVNASWRADLVFLRVIQRAGASRARELFVHYGMPDGGAEVLGAGDYDARLFSDALDLLRSSEEALDLVGLKHVDTGSNTWALDGRLTRSGAPLLANDLHMGFVAPNPNFLARLMAPGLDVRGICLPGIPGVLLGHNERIAWGSTALMADAQDLFIEELDEEGTRYRFRGEWLPVETWEEEILLRDREPDRVRVRLTHHGPVVQWSGRFGLALRWERLDTPPGDPTFHALNTATDWRTFRDALRSYPLPPTDFTYADVDGNVGAQSAGCVPVRAAGDGALPVPGKEGAYEWLGYVPFDELPSVYRPRRGFVVRANQNHDAGACGHFLSRRWHPPYRARRIQELVLGSQEHTVESLAQIQFDRFSAHTAFVAERIAAAAEEGGASIDAQGKSALALLRKWDGQLSPGSAAASIAKECSALLKAKLFGSVLGKSLLLDYQRFWPASNLAAERVLAAEDRHWLPEGTTDYASLYRSVLREALGNLRNVFGTKDPSAWSWGKLNVIRFAHPLESVPFFGDRFRLPPVEAGSDGECVFSSRSVGDYISSQQSAMLDWDAGRGAIFGASVRLIWDVGDWDNSSLMLNLGQSADPRSPHYRDHLEQWRAGGLQKLPFSWDVVRETSVRSLRL